ncbi:hypothetical protein ABI59_06680 [Acidobacteria bacterium Mor1]|nr:hypothetical protein ABI59_06680 [Acidobacteria bacterium Mor1]
MTRERAKGAPWWLRLVRIPALLVCVLTVAGFLGRYWWRFDLASHFRVQYALALAPVVLLMLATRRWRHAAGFGLFLAVNLALIAPLFYSYSPIMKGGTHLTTLALNVEHPNERSDLVLAELARTEPDIVVLQEVGRRWLSELTPFRERYAYKVELPRSDYFGIALYSKYPILDHRELHYGIVQVPSIVARLDVQGQALTVVGTHPLPPVSAFHSEERNLQLQGLAEIVADVEGPVLLLGDLNATRWSHHFQRLTEESGLRAPHGRYRPTWPVGKPWFWIQIDHGLVRGLAVTGSSTGSDVGSDHYPLYLDVHIPGMSPRTP